MKKTLFGISLLLILSLTTTLAAQTQNEGKTNNAMALGDTQKVIVMESRPKRQDSAMKKWRANRFGMFVTFGLFSITGGENDMGELRPYAAEWVRTAFKDKKKYDALRDQFNPKNFSAKSFAEQLKKTGVKYMIFVAKFHDGFCIWNTEFTDHNVMKTPYGKDIMKDIFREVRTQNIDIFAYYSIMDWYHPDYRATIKNKDGTVNPDAKAAFERYITFMKNQLREILVNYDGVTGLWFDGRWDPSYKQFPEYGIDIENFCKTVKPGLIINDRVRAYDSYADYDAAYERRLPNQKLTDRDWECVMTMTQGSWGNHKAPWANGWKTPRTILEMLVKCTSHGGSFAINIGPDGDGTLRPEEKERLDIVGEWMTRNGDIIYGAHPVDYASYDSLHPKIRNNDGADIYFTQTGNRINMIAFDWPEGNRIVIPTSFFPTPPVKAAIRISDGYGKNKHAPLSIKQEGKDYIFATLPIFPPDGGKLATVFEFEMENQE